MDIVHRLKEDLFSSEPVRVNNAILAIYWIADVYTFGKGGDGVPQSEPYVNEINNTSFDGLMIDELKVMLRSFIESAPTDMQASAIAALGKFFDQSDVELFNKTLEQALTGLLSFNNLLHQSLISLNNISVVASENGISLIDVDENIRLARGHLRSQGKTFSW